MQKFLVIIIIIAVSVFYFVLFIWLIFGNSETHILPLIIILFVLIFAFERIVNYFSNKKH